MTKRTLMITVLMLVCCLGVSCQPYQTPAASGTALDLVPEEGAYFGFNLDWAVDSPSSLNLRLGRSAAVFVQFFEFPLNADHISYLESSCQTIAGEGGMLLITLEPFGGLDLITAGSAAELADEAAACNADGVPVFIRFAHEMNGSWYPWGLQPGAYVKAFQQVADAVHSRAHQTAMLWAPNYGGGYPFAGGKFEALPGSPDFVLLDTNGDGILDMSDDPYSPYYPGDDAVDWVGMSIYHWGNTYPWGENELPERGKFIAQLTGTYVGLNGDDGALPDFYTIYFEQHGKPLAIPETAAFFDSSQTGPDELAIKSLWWGQVFDKSMLESYPGIKMINWFEHAKNESEVGGALIDWRVLGSPEIAEQFLADLPYSSLLFGP